MFQVPSDFTPDFSKAGGLIAAVAQDAATGEVLMLAWMNLEAWEATLATGEAHYWSRSRQKLWHKGESSGNVQVVKAIRLDCDSDAVVLEIEQVGGSACHTGRRSCFYRRIVPGVREVSVCSPQVFDPEEVYKK
ncbi:phosphoribosyl-AMP cyclohydrolase [Mailhella sp.]|uniref:phosphoribosyl-AMP cyclohydrolase n=1 Tax=Mailhella sp. TaxID=1981029 RepID=UPI003AB76AD2